MTALEIVETGEVVQPMTAEEASSITTQIVVKLDAIADNYQAVMPMIREALTRQAHLALGYAAPGAYVADRFGRALARMAAGSRRAFVAELTDAGMSTRQIAPVFGVSQRTVVNDRHRAGEQFCSPADTDTPSPTIPQGEPVSRGVGGGSIPEPILTQEQCEELDDEEYCDCGDGLCECLMGECSCGGIVPDLPESDRPETAGQPQPRITGTDGKSYPVPPKPSEPKRKPLPDSFWRATFDLGKEVGRIEKLTADDRFNRNADQIAQTNLHDLIRARDALQRVIDKLNPSGV